MRSFFIVCVVFLSAAGNAAAQTSVAEYYRAYSAALERNDMDAAAQAAEAALNASRQRDGDGGSTAVLALNLAHVQLDRGARDAAAAPAYQALTIARARGIDSRVDPVVAELALLRARLSSKQDAEILLAFMQSASGSAGGYDERFYAAAADLGDFALPRRDYAIAAAAWRAGAESGAGNDEAAVLARARALRGLGLSLLLDNTNRRGRTTFLGTNVDAIGTDAIEPLSEATRITRALVLAQPYAGSVTLAQRSYAQSLSLLAAARSQLNGMMGLGLEVEVEADLLRGVRLLDRPDVPPCTMRWHSDRSLRYPRRMADDLQVGAVVMRFVVSDEGVVIEREALAVTGAQEFADTAARATWRAEIERGENACSPAGAYIYPLIFTLDR